MGRNETGAGRVTLATIAEALGVSRATVSNAYNRPDRLSAQLREQVLRTAHELGYAGPDPVAATLARGRIAAIGVVLEDPMSFAFADPAASLLLQGISEVCGQQDSALVLIPGPSGPIARVALVDGVICYCDLPDGAALETIRERRLPFVVVDAPRTTAPGTWASTTGPRPGPPHVTCSTSGTAGSASSPCRCTPTGGRVGRRPSGRPRPLPGHPSTAGRVPGRARRGRPRSRRGGRGGAGPYGRDAGRRAAHALLARDPRPTAVLAMSDELALGVLDAALSLGLDVPGDLSVVGFDDVPGAALARPALTTVRQPHREKGRAAASMLLPGPVRKDPVVLPTDLVVRGSTGPRRP
ncbi:LacI family DNA-binding transcriptional regulator [Pseudonocardia sp. ICBG601]|uniref:LacI family DNA-binding transcriptional regulator n=1 Tax=Pseudonocardia sp. ICBG601 TaxID=2846759 RepID=UPI001CF6E659|nr:substrate-binding domain-containing protein [Pseudonocardia sp. ICBG601]